MNDRMHAIRQDELVGSEVLKLTDVRIPEPGMGEIVRTIIGGGVAGRTRVAVQGGF